MRKSYLENSIGERLSIMDSRNLWFNDPAGLGMEMQRGYKSPAPGFWVATQNKDVQVPLTGDLIFMANEVYDYFTTITDWILAADGLKHIQILDDGPEMCRDISIDIIEKTEKRYGRVLECPVKIMPLSPWYNRYHLSFEFSAPPEEDFKIFDYTYPYRFPASAQDNAVDFQIGGHYPGEVVFRADGPLGSPRLTLAETNGGKVLGRMDLSAISIAEGQRLLFSSRVNDPGVWRIVKGQRQDLMNHLNVGSGIKSFFQVPRNVPVTVTLEVSGVIESRSTLEIYEYFRVR